MAKYKIGDKVRIKRCIEGSMVVFGEFVGLIGVIVEIADSDEFYNIECSHDRWKNTFWHSSEIEPAKVRNTKLARKMNPDMIIDGDWLICG